MTEIQQRGKPESRQHTWTSVPWSDAYWCTFVAFLPFQCLKWFYEFNSMKHKEFRIVPGHNECSIDFPLLLIFLFHVFLRPNYNNIYKCAHHYACYFKSNI